MGFCRLARFVALLLSTHVLSAYAQVVGVDHVVIVGVDGLSPDGVRMAETPVLHRLMGAGAWTFHARGVMPTSSSPNWASMIMGAGPEQHGVTSNDWQPDRFAIAPVAVGPGGIFPTIFSVLKQQRPGARLACFHDWDGFGRLVERALLDRIEDANGPEAAVDLAVSYFRQARPQLTFIHLDHVDHAGHKQGHGTPEYYQAVAEADRLVGRVIDGLKEASMWDRTILLITADHGGKGKKHGGATMDEIEIPWILHGPGVAAGREISAPVNTYDTAATVAAIFGLKPPDCWIGRPVRAAFETLH
jgi:predicted AlkP superfamily pyrophosphatase or phosphodiesterase